MKHQTSLAMCALTILAIASTLDAQAQEVARGALRGAMVGGIFDDAGKGAAIGAGVGAVRKIDDRQEAKARQAEAESYAEYQSSQQYSQAPHAEFDDPANQPSEPLGPAAGDSAELSEIVLRKDGTPVLAVGYPSNWKQSVDYMSVTANSPDGAVWSTVAELEFDDLDTAEAGAMDWLKNELDAVAFRETEEGRRGARVISGTAKSKKNGATLEFVAAVFQAAPETVAGAVIIADGSASERFTTTVQHIGNSIRTAEDF